MFARSRFRNFSKSSSDAIVSSRPGKFALRFLTGAAPIVIRCVNGCNCQ